MNSIWKKWKQYLVDLITNLIFSYAIDCIIAKLRKQAKYKLQYTSNITNTHLVYLTNWGQCLFSTLKQDTDNKQIGYSMNSLRTLEVETIFGSKSLTTLTIHPP